MAYLGASPLASFASPSKDTFSGNNSTTAFTMSQSASDANSIEVFVDNVRQEPTTAYTVNGTTLSFTGTPATGSNNIYVIHKQGVIGNGLLPTRGRDSDRVTNMTVDGDLNTKGNIAGNILHPITLDGTDGSSSDAGDNLVLEGTDSSSTNAGDMILHEINTDDINKVGQVDTTNFQFDNNVLVKGNVEVQGNLVAPTTGGRVTIESGTDATTGFLILNSSAASTDVGEQILFEDGTNDPASYFNNDLVAFGGEVSSTSITSPTIRKDASSTTFTLPSADGTDGQAIITDASGNLSFGDAGGGKVLQVVTASKNDSFTTSSNSFVEVTDLSVSITPSATSSKVLILATVLGQRGQTEGTTAQLTIFKGSSNLIDDLKDSSSAGIRTGMFTSGGTQSDGTDRGFESYNYHLLDSPNTTSSVTYSVRANSYSSTTFTINRVTNPDNDALRPFGVSSITLMEIGA